MGGPRVREQLQAVALSALCGLAFLGPGAWPGNAVVPFPPEAIEPLRSEVLASGERRLEELLLGNASLGDKYGQSLAWDRITRDALVEGRIPRWTREIGGGASFVPQMGQVYQPWTWLLRLLPAPGIYGLWFLLHQVVFGWLGYRFLRRIGTSHAAGLF